MKDQFYEMADKLQLSACTPFKSIDEVDHHNYLMSSNDHLKGEMILINPLYALRMSIEKGELSWLDLSFEQKILTNQLSVLGPSR